MGRVFVTSIFVLDLTNCLLLSVKNQYFLKNESSTIKKLGGGDTYSVASGRLRYSRFGNWENET
jgi:hypothetical protein